MANNVLIMGESGTGKSTSIRTLDPMETCIINVLDKPLPFKGYKSAYTPLSAEGGNYYATDNADRIIRVINGIADKRPDIRNVVIDDFQYVMANEYMRRAKERGFDKFTDIGQNAWNIINACVGAPAHMNFFILSHTEVSEGRGVKIKTIGKMLDEKITLEGMFTVVLHALLIDGQYKLLTQYDGLHIAKSPLGMFEEKLIDNDLHFVQSKITNYFTGD